MSISNTATKVEEFDQQAIDAIEAEDRGRRPQRQQPDLGAASTIKTRPCRQEAGTSDPRERRADQ